eukprot:SM000015S01248  [mRNA]  locus=s15:802563:808955:+ [translate_table: standard]
MLLSLSLSLSLSPSPPRSLLCSFLPRQALQTFWRLLTPLAQSCSTPTASVFYIFCREEPLWMHLCLGAHGGGPLCYDHSWRHTTLRRLAADKGRSPPAPPAPPLPFDGFTSLFLYRRWYRCHVALAGFALDDGAIDRRAGVDTAAFARDFDGIKPVVLTDVAAAWPAMRRWSSLGALAAAAPAGAAFKVSQSQGKKVTMELKDYLAYMDQQRDEEPLYIFDEKFGETAPALLDDYRAPPQVVEDYLSLLGPDKRPSYRWLVAGPARSGASWHVDPALTSAWNALTAGKKRWALYPPGRVPPGVTVQVDEVAGEVDFDGPTSLQWWLEVYPCLRPEDRPLECTQVPGEVIFVPSGWWHCVLNLEDSVAVTQNYVNEANLEAVCRDMAPGFRHRGVARAGRLAEELGGRRDRYLGRVDSRGRTVKKGKVLADAESADLVKDLESAQLTNDWELREADFAGAVDHFADDSDGYLSRKCLREWLCQLWLLRPHLRDRVWQCACMAMNAGEWLKRVQAICVANGLPLPEGAEKFPVGRGSNPVYILGNLVLKIYTDTGGLGPAAALSTELCLYKALDSASSPLSDRVPPLITSGILYPATKAEQQVCVLWDGAGDLPPRPGTVSNCNGDVGEDGNCGSEGLLGNIQEDHPEARKRMVNGGLKEGHHGQQDVNGGPGQDLLWPFIVTRKCEGQTVDTVYDLLTPGDFRELAAFLGTSLRALHSLPLPSLTNFHSDSWAGGRTSRQCKSMHTASLDPVKGLEEFSHWRPFVQKYRLLRSDAVERLKSWSALPPSLQEELESYLPSDMADLIPCQDRPPVWLHSDVTDNNVLVKPIREGATTSACPSQKVEAPVAGVNGLHCDSRRYSPAYLLDFGDVEFGDPLMELLAVHICVFRCDHALLSHFLSHYNLPLQVQRECSRGEAEHQPSSDGAQPQGHSYRTSYRAMCYCLVHELNPTAAIFGHRADLLEAKSLREVEDAIWGPLNSYFPSSQAQEQPILASDHDH